MEKGSFAGGDGMNPLWLVELHRQWQAVRGRDAAGRSRAFSREWDALLNAAGIVSGEMKLVAVRELETLAAKGYLEIRRPARRRYLIEKVILPLSQEPWLRGLFGSAAPTELHARSLSELSAWMDQPHPLLPQLWRMWCQTLHSTFLNHRNHRPFYSHKPEANNSLLSLVFKLTARTWPDYTLVRDADVELGYHTKVIERCHSSLEDALSQLHGRPMTLESLGLIMTNSKLHFDGPLRLEFSDGTQHEAGNLRYGDWVTAADLDRAVRITTTAKRLLSVENSKTTFPKLIELNCHRDTLIVASSFPTTAIKLLLAKLSPSIPHHHFGDTDPAGYFILQKLRQLTMRPVQPLEMDWLPQLSSPQLTEYDHRVIPQLLATPDMGDCHQWLRTMLESGRKGKFEQETRDVTNVWKKLGT